MIYYDRDDMTASQISKTPCTFIMDISDNKKIYTMRFFLNGKLHRTNGPASFSWEPERPDKLYQGTYWLNSISTTRPTFEEYATMPLEKIPLHINGNSFYKQILDAKLKGERTYIVSNKDPELINIMNQMIERYSYF